MIKDFLKNNPDLYLDYDVNYSELHPYIAYIAPLYIKPIFNEFDKGDLYQGKIIKSGNIHLKDEFFTDFDVVIRVGIETLYVSLHDPNLFISTSNKRYQTKKLLHEKEDRSIRKLTIYHGLNPNYDEYEFLNKYVKEQEFFEENPNMISRLEQTQMGWTLNQIEINPYDVSLSKHYNDGFENESDEIIKKLNDDKSGIFLLNGVPGTGKTSYIEYLTSCVSKPFVWIPIALFENLFTDPTAIDFVHNHLKDTILIIEDAENILSDDGKRSTATSTLLNMTSGTISKVLNLKVIATFNVDTKRLDKALMRPGRLRHHYEFKPLSEFKAYDLADELGLNIDNKEYTLAELYNFKEIKKDESSRKIGFGKG